MAKVTYLAMHFKELNLYLDSKFWVVFLIISRLKVSKLKVSKRGSTDKVNKPGAEIHQALLSQFYLLLDFFIVKILVKDLKSTVFRSVNFTPGSILENLL